MKPAVRRVAGHEGSPNRLIVDDLVVATPWTTRSIARLRAVRVARDLTEATSELADALAQDDARGLPPMAVEVSRLQEELLELTVVIARIEGHSWETIAPSVGMRPRKARRRYNAAVQQFRRQVAVAPLTDPTAATSVDRTLVSPETEAAELRDWARLVGVSPLDADRELNHQLHDQAQLIADLQITIRRGDLPAGTDGLHARLYLQDLLIAFFERLLDIAEPGDPAVETVNERLRDATTERASILGELGPGHVDGQVHGLRWPWRLRRRH